jgi:hypothetical protein
LDQASKHRAAQAIAAAARAHCLMFAIPQDLIETLGEGDVGGRRALVGGASFVAARAGVAAG